MANFAGGFKFADWGDDNERGDEYTVAIPKSPNIDAKSLLTNNL
jgi:hypothetical protein